MTRRLFRSTSGNMLGGVCTGIAQYLGVDPVIVRVAFVLAAFADGLGILAYILLLIIVPRQPWQMSMQDTTDDDTTPFSTQRAKPAFWFGATLVAVGLLAFANEFVPWFDMDALWPVLLIILGGGLIFRSMRQKEQAAV